MKEYGQYCPVALASAVIAERWTPLIIRELVIGGRRFNEIDRGLPGISRSLLKQRLDHLERKGVIDKVAAPHGHEYHLTPPGATWKASSWPSASGPCGGCSPSPSRARSTRSP